jgi:hypothetical protein
MDKNAKIPSASVTAIKDAMRQLIEKQKTIGLTNNEKQLEASRQGIIPETQLHGMALPP